VPIKGAETCRVVTVVGYSVRMADIFDDIAAAVEAERTATERVDALLREAKTSGITWVTLASRSNLSLAAVRWRAKRAAPDEEQWGYVLDRRARAEAGEPAPERTPADPRELTFTEAARRSGVTRQTIYQWKKAGRLRLVSREGREFVLAEPDGSVALADV
jgi:DNA invertase Pin-like site-specific DNA recombinase